MKKTKALFLPVIVCACAEIFYSCTPDDDNGVDMTDTGATWTLGTQPFQSGSVDNDETQMQIHSTTGSTDGIFVRYGSEPHDRGAGFNYTIVNFNQATLAYNEIAIEIDHGISDVWLSTGGSGKFAITQILGSEIRISSKEPFEVQHYATNGPQADSTTAVFNVGTR